MSNNIKILLYGVGGASKQYAVLRYYAIYEDEPDMIGTIKRTADWMRVNNPSIMAVYAISNRRGLYHDYMEARRHNSIESHAIFRDILEREGIKLPL